MPPGQAPKSVASQKPRKERRLGSARGLLWERAVLRGEAQEERAKLCCHPSSGYIQQHTLTGLTGPLPAAGSAQLPLFR